jgi:hypothetical protein
MPNEAGSCRVYDALIHTHTQTHKETLYPVRNGFDTKSTKGELELGSQV